ncbi:MAG: hypothetical protein IPG10_15565 [Flavobacteriales bacterium]|nr:hypothetical protein [Flavobacteriales bacterium]MBK7268820.1 hypothetical protein [Flavobacteriales bacterium]MBK9074385.1 hypothetical protein [Flavobacteriales bacterium]
MTRNITIPSALRALLFAAVLPLIQPALAQRDSSDMHTLFGGARTIKHGGWGGPSAVYTRMLDQEALLVGFKAGWLINHRFSMGLAGYGLVTEVKNPAYDTYLQQSGQIILQPSQFEMGYGGLLLESIIAYKSPVHVSLPVLIGAGGCTYQRVTPPTLWSDSLSYVDDSQAFFVVEPGIDIELNVTRYLRLGLGGSYRLTSDMELPATAKDALHGINAALTIKVGVF